MVRLINVNVTNVTKVWTYCKKDLTPPLQSVSKKKSIRFQNGDVKSSTINMNKSSFSLINNCIKSPLCGHYKRHLKTRLQETGIMERLIFKGSKEYASFLLHFGKG